MMMSEEPNLEVAGVVTPENTVGLLNDQQSVHDIIYPFPVHRGQRIAAVIDQKQCNLVGLSPFGATMTESYQGEFGEIGARLPIRIHIADQSTELLGRIEERTQKSGQWMIGIRWGAQGNVDIDANIERPHQLRDARFDAGQFLKPTGFFSQHLKGDIHFELEDLSADGAAFTTSLRNSLLIPGLTFESQIRFPRAETLKTKLQIRHIRVFETKGAQRLRVGVAFLSPSVKVRSEIAKHVYEFSPDVPSPKRLKKNKLILSAFDKGLSFDDVRTEKEYQEVLELRALAYGEYNEACRTVAQLRDDMAVPTRILAVRHHGRMIATAVISYPTSIENMQVSKSVTDRSLIPNPTLCGEAGRVCTHPEYRGKSVLVVLMQHITMAIAQAGKRYIVSTSPENVFPIYQWAGGKAFGNKFQIEELGKIGLAFQVDLHEVFACRKIGWKGWFFVYWQAFKTLNKDEWQRRIKHMPMHAKVIKHFSGFIEQKLLAKVRS